MLKSESHAPAIKLKGIKRAKIAKGGWSIDYDFVKGAGTKRYGLWLALAPPNFTSLPPEMLTVRILKGLPRLNFGGPLTSDFLPNLLRHILIQDLWGKVANAFLIAMVQNGEGKTMTMVSEPRPLHCPFKPLIDPPTIPGDLKGVRNLGAFLRENQVPYEIDASLATSLEVDSRAMIFFHGSKFLKPDGAVALKRGLNCITFLDLALGTDLDNVVKKTGADLAEKLGATTIADRDNDKVRKHFTGDTDTRPNSYILWWDSHCTIVTGNIVCEYSQSAKGYRETKILDFLKKFSTIKLSLAQVG